MHTYAVAIFYAKKDGGCYGRTIREVMTVSLHQGDDKYDAASKARATNEIQNIGVDTGYYVQQWEATEVNMSEGEKKPQQVPSVGRVVHFVYGGQHVPAIITDPAFVVREEGKPDWEGQALTVFLPNAQPFTTVAAYGEEVAPGTHNNATWHWPEYVPAK